MITARKKKRRSIPVAGWVGLACEPESFDTWIASLGKTKRDAMLKVECRIERISTVEAFPINEAMGELIYRWLVSLGASEQDASQAVRDIGRRVVEIFK